MKRVSTMAHFMATGTLTKCMLEPFGDSVDFDRFLDFLASAKLAGGGPDKIAGGKLDLTNPENVRHLMSGQGQEQARKVLEDRIEGLNKALNKYREVADMCGRRGCSK